MTWKILEEEIYETFRIFNIRRSARINPRTGERFDFFLMDGLDWVNVIAITDKDELVLVRQYRHGSESYTLEIPGGCVEKDEDPKDSIKRELSEETGYQGGEWQELGVIHPNPAMQSIKCHVFLARGIKKTKEQKLDPGEDIEVVLKPLAELNTLISSGQISHAIVLAACALFQNWTDKKI